MRLSKFASSTVVWVGVLHALHIAVPARSLANGAAFGFGAGSVFPIASDDIRLESEIVEVRLPSGHGSEWSGSVKCFYLLENLTQQDRHIMMGFVTRERYPSDLMAWFYRDAEFSARVGDREVPVEFHPVASSAWPASLGSPPDSIPVWPLSIGPGESLPVEIQYRIKAGGGSEGRHVYLHTTYRARPAALWAGTIRYAEIRFRLDPLSAALLGCNPDTSACIPISIDPGGYRRTSDSVIWEMKDWEPSQDFRFAVEWYVPQPGSGLK